MSLIALAISVFVCAAIPAWCFLRNRWHYEPPPLADAAGELPAVSVLIPARNEERAIAGAVEAALATVGVSFEVVVLDDHSTDATAAIVAEIAGRDPRVRLVTAPPLPPGWCGKQHACHTLASLARHPVMMFLDADVRLAPDGLARMTAFLVKSGASLVSGVPRQETGTALERLVIPLIHFVLLGFLPISRMRRSTAPSYAAGCGQLFVARRAAYESIGGHGAVRASLHDGLTLPRAFRRAGHRTDLCDATAVATCRMYRSAGELWAGLAKNAREGLAAPRLLLPVTAVLLLGQVAPLPVLTACLAIGDGLGAALAGAAAVLGYAVRFTMAARFRQSWLGAILHPVGVLLLLAIQWDATFRALIGRPSGWKGRAYPAANGPALEST